MSKTTHKVKNPQVFVLILAGLIVLAAIAALGLMIWQNFYPPKGNTPGNLNNMGIAAESGGWVFTVNGTPGSEGLYKVRPDGTEAVQLFSGECGYLNAVGDTVYFIGKDSLESNLLYKISASGGAAQLLYKNTAKILVVGQWIYLQEYEPRGIGKIKTDGSRHTLLAEGNIVLTAVEDGWVYYLSGRDLYKMKTDGSNPAPVLNNVVNPVIEGEWIYYCRGSENYSEFSPLVKTRLDGSETMTLTDQGCKLPNLDGDWIYYSASDGIGKIKTDGSGQQKISGDTYLYMNLTSQWLVYRSDKGFTGLLGGSWTLLKMHKDGSENTEFWDR